MEILGDRNDNEAYAVRKAEELYIIYFPLDGVVTVELALEADQYKFSWIDIRTGEDQKIELDEKSGKVTLTSLSDTGGFYILTRNK